MLTCKPSFAKPLASTSGPSLLLQPLRKRSIHIIHARKQEETSTSSSGRKVVNLGVVELIDDGWDVLVRVGRAKVTVPKTEAVGYIAPVVGLAAMGIIGALFLGPAILSFMMVAGAVIASISAFSAILVAVFIVPAAVALIFAFGSVAGGLAIGASTLAIGFGAVALMGSLIMKAVQPEAQKIMEKEVPARDEWLESFEADQERINDDLEMFDERLKRK